MNSPNLKLPSPHEDRVSPPHKISKFKLITSPSQASPPARFSRLHKLLLTLLLGIGLLYCDTCYPGGPDILSAKPESHSFGKFWEKSKSAQLRTLAMLIEMYPQHELYFLERDATLLGQTGLAIAQIENEDSLKNRIHFLQISRKNLKDPLLLDYLKQEGISKETLSQGKQVLFIDTGFVGSIPRAIIKHFPDFENQIAAHMIVAAPDDREWRNPFPSSRVFGTAFSDIYPLQDILEGGLDVVHPYAKIPKADLRSDTFYKNPRGVIFPIASLQSRDENDGEINPIKTRQYEEDLQFFLRQSNSRLLLNKMRAEWKTAHSLWEKGKKQELIAELNRWVHLKGAQGLAMALDFMEITHTNLVGDFTITPLDLGIPAQELNLNEKKLAQKNLPIWKPSSCKQVFRQLTRPSASENLFPE